MDHYNFAQVSAAPLVTYRHVGWDPDFLAGCGLSVDLRRENEWPAWDVGFVGLVWRLLAGYEIVVIPTWDAQHVPESLGAPSVVQWRYEIGAENESEGGHGFRELGFRKQRDVPSYVVENWGSIAATTSYYSLRDASEVTGIFGLKGSRVRKLRKQLSSDHEPSLPDLLDPGDVFIARYFPREVDLGDLRVPCIMVAGYSDLAERLQRATTDLYGAIGQFRRNARHFCSMDEAQSAIEDVGAPPSWGP